MTWSGGPRVVRAGKEGAVRDHGSETAGLLGWVIA